jgi:hypothetical protein
MAHLQSDAVGRVRLEDMNVGTVDLSLDLLFGGLLVAAEANDDGLGVFGQLAQELKLVVERRQYSKSIYFNLWNDNAYSQAPGCACDNVGSHCSVSKVLLRFCI